MKRYLLRRIIETIILGFVVATILFALFRLMPGDPTALVISPALDDAVQLRLKQLFGLDKPLYQQYLIYLKNIVTLDWGISFTTQEPVFDILVYRFWNTVFLMGFGITIAFVAGLIGGVFMAWKRKSKFDSFMLISSLVFRSAPEFFLGMILLIIFAYGLRWFPIGLMHEVGYRADSFFQMYFNLDFLYHAFLPTLTAAIFYLATPLLIMRSSMLTTLGSDYIEIAIAKGISRTKVVFKHAARNALLPVVTVSSVMVGFAMGGQVMIETVFSWPGMGIAMVEAVRLNNYPVAQSSFLLMSMVVIVLNLVTDILYAYLDPRIRY